MYSIIADVFGLQLNVSLAFSKAMSKRSAAECLWHARNWMRRSLANYDEKVHKQFLEPRDEAMRVEQYFRCFLNDNSVTVLYNAFMAHPIHFQMFLYLFWAKYWNRADGFWTCVEVNADVVHCCESFWQACHILPSGLMPCPVVENE